MKRNSPVSPPSTNAGIALLIAIFVLLLVCVVGIAMMVASGTETALTGNYQSSTGVYYAALAGLEEGRGRLLPKNPNYINIAAPGFLPSPGTPLPIGKVLYIENPTGSTTTYPDTEYTQEFASAPSSITTIPSVSPIPGPPAIPGPLFKWVRINAITEKSINVDTNADNTYDSTTPLFYDGSHLNLTSTGYQALEVTSLAVYPDGSQKMLQYVVAPSQAKLPPLLAALTIAGSTTSTATFHAPASNAAYAVKGNDQDCSGSPTGLKFPAIGVFTGSDITNVVNGIPSSNRVNYTGAGAAPDVENIGSLFPANLQIPSQLDALAQSLTKYADVVITPAPSSTPPYLGTAYGSDLTPLNMSSTNILTVVVQGNLDISNWARDGYGLLLVTGTFTYDPDTNWNGIVLVIGQGEVEGGPHMQFKQINGAMFVAATRDPTTNNVLVGSNLGPASVEFDDNMQGNGIRYSNCWIQKAQPLGPYQIISYREIPQ